MVHTSEQEMNIPRVAGQQSVRRAIEVLFALDASGEALTAAEVAEHLGMNRTTVWRYLQTLAGSGMVREVGEGRFGLGPRTVSLADAYTRQWAGLSQLAGVALVQLRDAIGETAALHVRQEWSRIVVRQVESHHELRRTYRDMGRQIPLLTGAPSLALLAALPDHEQRFYLDQELGADPGAREQLERQLAEIATRGWAISWGARVPGVASVAVAVRDPAGRGVAAVNVTGPEDRVFAPGVETVARAVVENARWVELKLEEVPQSQPPTDPPS